MTGFISDRWESMWLKCFVGINFVGFDNIRFAMLKK